MSHLTVSDFAQVFRFLRQADLNAADAFSQSITELSERPTLPPTEQPAKLQSALQKWGKATKAIQRRQEQLATLPPASLLREMSLVTKETLNPLLKRILAAVNTHFPAPAQVQTQLQQEAARLSIHETLSRGLIALFEIVGKRPRLSGIFPYLPNLYGHLRIILRSFANERGIMKEQGISELTQLQTLLRQVQI